MLAGPAFDFVALMRAERAALLDLLAGLPRADWDAPSSCPGWTAKDLAAHLLGDDLGNESTGRDRDGQWFTPKSWEELLALINAANEQWVAALRRLSTGVLIELLRDSGRRTFDHFAGLDGMAPGPNVAWAGTGQHPMWLHIAREYTERWLHGQQIREAVGASAFDAPESLHPVLDTFALSLPVAFGGIAAPSGVTVDFEVEGPAGGTWHVVREGDGWTASRGPSPRASATVRLPQDAAWRMYTKGIPPAELWAVAVMTGDPALGARVLSAVAIIA